MLETHQSNPEKVVVVECWRRIEVIGESLS